MQRKRGLGAGSWFEDRRTFDVNVREIGHKN